MNAQELLDKRKEDFIKTRYAIEQKVNSYMTRVFAARELEPVWFSNVQFPNGKTAQEVLPSMYAEKFDPDAYMAELDRLLIFARQIEAVADAINKEAERCLSM